MRDKLIAAGVKNLREFGYPQCTKDNKGKAGADGWISLRERYPEHGQECVVATEDGAIQVATFFDTCGFVSDNPTGKLVEYWTPKSNKGSSLQWLEVLKKGIPMNGNWQPIETYDALKKKPRFAVFYVEATTAGRGYLSEMIVTERLFGYRTITHWVALPDLPSNKQHNS